MEKITKKMVLKAIRLAAENGADFNEGAVTSKDVIEYVDKTIAQLDAKAEKAKNLATKKKLEGDDLYKLVLATINMGDEDKDYWTVNEVTAKVNETDEEATRAKVIARLTKGIKEGFFYKTQVKIDGKKTTVYGNKPFKDDEADEQ